MTRKLPQSRQKARKALGTELRRLRVQAGISSGAMAEVIGRSLSTVSLIESGSRAIGADQVTAWLKAVSDAIPGGLDDEIAEYVGEVTRRATMEVTPLAGSLAARQAGVAELEETATAICNWQPGYVAGLLQTRDYARAVFSMLKAPEQVEAAVAERIARQGILGDSSRKLEFITTEQGLAWRPEGPDPRPAQLDRIASLAALPHIGVRVIPVGAVMYTPPVGPFTLYEWEDGGVVKLEFPGERGSDTDIAGYKDDLDKLRPSAWSGDEAIAFIRDLARRIAP